MVTPNSKNNHNQRVELDLNLNPKYSEDFKTVIETEDFSDCDLITDKTTKKKHKEKILNNKVSDKIDRL
jgi:hypothetical protein